MDGPTDGQSEVSYSFQHSVNNADVDRKLGIRCFMLGGGGRGCSFTFAFYYILSWKRAQPFHLPAPE